MRAVRRGRSTRRWALSAVAVFASLLLARWTSDSDPDPAPTNRVEADRIDGSHVPNTGHRPDSRSASTEIDTGSSGGIPPHGASAGFVPDAQGEDSTVIDERPTRDAVESIYLEPFARERDGPTFSLSGFDPYAPRELVAWRILHGRAVVMSRGSSDSRGGIHFPEILAPRDGFEVVISEAGFRPESRGASPRRRLAPRAPAAPHAQVFGASGHYELRIVPTETTGAVLLADLAGNTFASYDVPADPEPSNRVINISVTLPQTDTEIWMSHRLKDGRVSPWRVLPLPHAVDTSVGR